MQFIPAHWLELANWNRPMTVYSYTVPDPEPTIQQLLAALAQQKCKASLSVETRPAA